MVNNNKLIDGVSQIDVSKLRLTPRQKPCDPFESYGNAAQHWFSRGFNVIPLVPGTKQTAVKWDSWLENPSSEKIAAHWASHPDHEIGFIVGDDIIVLDADSPAAIAALAELEDACSVVPHLTVKTAKGVHHYFKRAKGTYAKSDSHSTQEHPERLDVKTGRSMVILPPSKGKSLDIDDAENACDLTEVSQEFIDAVSRHNGRLVPRPFESVPPERILSVTSSQTFNRIKALLDHLTPDSGYENWLRCGMAIFHGTDGSSEGLDLFDRWSRKGKTYKDRKEIEAKWRSFKTVQNNPVTIGTLIKMVKDSGGDWIAPCDDASPQFERCETVIINPCKQSPNTSTRMESANPLDKFSLRGMSDELEKSAVEVVPLLGELALIGQATVFFSAPNTGKTLITISLLNDAIKDGRVDPSKVYYLNMDDSGNGLLEKLRIAEEYDFHMLAEGYCDFNASDFLSIVRGMIENDQARGVVVILDTLKKFVDLMDKGRTSSFTNVIRPFVLKGGTVIALAHTNKHPGKDGKPIYGGVSDIMNDIDCAYTIAPASENDGKRVVEFVNIKRRGGVVQSAAYSYCTGNKIPYNETLLSVNAVDLNLLEPLKQAEAIKSDAEVINAITACINDGVITKMKLADATATRANISKRAAMQIIEKYTGNDPATHKWLFSVRERGAKVFVLLDAAPPPPELEN
jgi:hypothetical protein